MDTEFQDKHNGDQEVTEGGEVDFFQRVQGGLPRGLERVNGLKGG